MATEPGSPSEPTAPTGRSGALRREPPAFRLLEVRGVEARTPRLQRLVLGGPALAGFDVDLPAASVRLLLPQPDGSLVIPVWNGNEFLFADGSRPPIRTLTPLPAGNDDEVTVDVVLHGPGALSTWARDARPGTPVALSGPGRGYEVDDSARAFLLVGDESALPAITTVVPALPLDATVDVVVEVTDPAARIVLPEHPRLTEQWCVASPSAPGAASHEAVVERAVAPTTQVWAAGEAAAMQRLRKHLFDDRGVPRSAAVVRGYWKRGRDRAVTPPS
jgi:NADPH-dependent ferric siderophore reductase